MDPYQFQWWALGKVRAAVTREEQRKGADRGVDGRGRFVEPGTAREREVIYQVKSGKVSSKDVRDLRGTLERENLNGRVPMACLLTFQKPTKEMVREAASAGFYSPVPGEAFPRIQMLTAQDLLDGKQPTMPQKLPAVGKSVPKAATSRRRARQGTLWA